VLDVIYKGTSFSSLGFYYIPTAQQRGDAITSFQTMSDSFTSRDGGIRYGSRVEVKKFELKFYYEYISPQQKESFIKLIDRRTGGELYFTERPYAKYTAYVSAKPSFEEYGHYAIVEGRRYSGIVTLQMEAYLPFARLTERYLDTLMDTEYYYQIHDETSIIVSAEDPMGSISTETAKPGEFIYDIDVEGKTIWNLKILYPGTEYGRLSFDVAGEVGEDGLTIYNGATEQTCKVVGLNSAITDQTNRWYHIDSETGQCVLTNGVSSNVDYMFHDYGYISLVPADIRRDVRVHIENGSSTIRSDNGDFEPSMVGKYINIGSDWKAITTYVSPVEMTISATPDVAADVMASIATMNIITITGGVNTSLSKLRLYMQGYVR